MIPRRPVILLSLALIMVATLVVLQTTGGTRQNAMSTPPAASMTEPSPTAFATGLDRQVSATFTGPAYDPAVSRSPTRHKPQSKVWYNDGIWWGVLVEKSTGEFHIWWLNVTTHAWVDTGTLVDARPYARQDVLSDGDDLIVASAGANETSRRHAVEITRYRYDHDHRIYERLPNYPMRVTNGGVDAVTVARDSTGAIWITFVSLGRVRIVASDSAGLRWSEPFIVPSKHSSVAADQAAIESLDGKIGVLWSNQEENGVFFATHADGTPLDDWTPTESVLDATAIADDHLSLRSLKRADGLWVYAVAKTSLDQLPGRNQQLPQIVFLTRSPSGTWSSYLVGRVADHHTRPILVIDGEHDEALIFATSPFDGGTIYMKTSSLAEPRFELGLGRPVIEESAVPKVNNATSTRQPVSSSTGLVVLAGDDALGQYLHVELGLGNRPPVDPEPQSQRNVSFVDATWDGVQPGASLRDQDWAITPPAADALVASAAGEVGVRLAEPDGAVSRMCRDLPRLSSGMVVVSARVNLEGQVLGDDHVISTRGNGTELTGARFLSDGTVAYRVGDQRQQAAGTWSRGVWYDLRLTADLQTGTYAWTARPAQLPQAAPIIDVAGVPLLASNPVIDQACIESPAVTPGGGMLVDSFAVVWERP